MSTVEGTGTPAEGTPAEGTPAEGTPAEGTPAEGAALAGRPDQEYPTVVVTPMTSEDLRQVYGAALEELAAYRARVRRLAIEVWTAQEVWCAEGLNRVLRRLDLDPHTPGDPDPDPDPDAGSWFSRPGAAQPVADAALGTAELLRLVTATGEDLAAFRVLVRRTAIEVWRDQSDWPLDGLAAVLRSLDLPGYTPHWQVTVSVTGQFAALRAGSAEHAARLVRCCLRLGLTGCEQDQQSGDVPAINVQVNATEVQPARWA